MSHSPDILIIDDDEDFCLLMAKMFASKNIAAAVAYSWKQGWNYILQNRPKLILLDNCLPDGLGIEQITQIKQNDHSTRVMVVSGECSPNIEHRAIAAGADYFSEKPFNFGKLADLVQFWMKKSFSSVAPNVVTLQ